MAAGWLPVSLGQPILRAETAAIASLAILGAATADRGRAGISAHPGGITHGDYVWGHLIMAGKSSMLTRSR